MDFLRIFHEPKITNPTLVMGFSGWMDGGSISTGTINYLRVRLGAQRFAEIDPEGFYILNFPGVMETASIFRPHVAYRDGLLQQFDYPTNAFFAHPAHPIILFLGQEPNLEWERYSQSVFEVCRRFSVRRILFIGSVAGIVPHTREARISCAISSDHLRPEMEKKGFRFINYEGPGSFMTCLMRQCAATKLDMAALIAEIPVYVQGYNPCGIETALRCISSLLDLHLEYDDLQAVAEDFEKRLNDLVARQPELAERIQQLEEIYDNEVFDSEMGDLKNWLQQRGVRLD